MRLYGAFVKHDALAGVIVFLAAGAKKAEAIIESLCPKIVGVRPELSAVVAACERAAVRTASTSLPPILRPQ